LPELWQRVQGYSFFRGHRVHLPYCHILSGSTTVVHKMTWIRQNPTSYNR